MELPDLVLLLIGLAIAGTTLVVVAMSRRRDHALRDRFEEEYDRTLREHGRRDEGR